VHFTGDALVTDDSILGRTGPRIVCGAFAYNTGPRWIRAPPWRRSMPGSCSPGHGSSYLAGIEIAFDEARRAGTA
jgi:hypothetical protein